MKNGKYKKFSIFVVLGLILSYTLINSCSTEQPLIKHVSVKGIIADDVDQLVFGNKVGDKDTIPPAPWRTRFKIALNGKKLDELQPNRDSSFDSTLFGFNGTLIDFRGSDLEKIPGFHFKLLEHDILEADFWIPKTIPNWHFKENSVLMVVKVTTVTDSLMTRKLGASLLSFTLVEPPESVEDEKVINKDLYKENEGENGFTGDDESTDDTINEPNRGTKLGC